MNIQYRIKILVWEQPPDRTWKILSLGFEPRTWAYVATHTLSNSATIKQLTIKLLCTVSNHACFQGANHIFLCWINIYISIRHYLLYFCESIFLLIFFFLIFSISHSHYFFLSEIAQILPAYLNRKRNVPDKYERPSELRKVKRNR